MHSQNLQEYVDFLRRALPEEDRDLQLAQLLGDDCPGGEQGEENFYRSEDFLVK